MAQLSVCLAHQFYLLGEWIHQIFLRKDITIGWKGYGFCFLGFQWYIVHRVFWKRKKNQQRLLLCIIGSIRRRNHNKTVSFIEEKCIFLQENAAAHKSVKMMKKSMNYASNCFLKMGNQWLFWRPWQIVLQKKHYNFKRSLD